MGKKRSLRIGATVGMLAGLYSLYTSQAGVSNKYKAQKMVQALTGYDYINQKFDIQSASAAIPMIGGVALSMVASKAGLNRYTPTGINI